MFSAEAVTLRMEVPDADLMDRADAARTSSERRALATHAVGRAAASGGFADEFDGFADEFDADEFADEFVGLPVAAPLSPAQAAAPFVPRTEASNIR